MMNSTFKYISEKKVSDELTNKMFDEFSNTIQTKIYVNDS